MPFASNPEMMAKSATVAEAFTQEKFAYVLSLLPTPEGFAELYNRVEANYPAALKGDPEKAKAFEADCKTLNCDLSLLLGLAKVVALKDPTVPETLGLGPLPEKTPHSTVPLTIPYGFKVSFDPKGLPRVSVTKVAGAKGYQVWACDSDPSTEANWRLAASSTSCRAITIPGLNRSKFNLLKIRAMRGNGAGPWSNWVSIDPS